MVSRHLMVKFYLWILLALTLSVAGAGAVVFLHSSFGFEERFRDWALREVEVGRDIAANLLGTGIEMERLRRVLAPLNAHSPFTVAIVDGKGEELLVLAGERNHAKGQVLPSPGELRRILEKGDLLDFHHEGRVAAGLPLQLPSGETGVFFVTLGKPPSRRESRHWQVLSGLAAFLGVLWLLSWPLASHLTRPLRKMADAAASLGGGDLSVRIPLKRRDEIGQLASSFNAMAENLQRIVNGHKQLLADISHELRSPLARLRIALELVRREGAAGLEEPLTRVERQADTMEEMIEELLTYSRLDTAPYTLHWETLDLGAVIGETVSSHQLEAERRNVPLQAEVAPGAQRVVADRTLLARALGNVISNGIMHSPPDRPLRIGAERRDGAVRISISDEGVGVDPELLESIFDPFVRADSARSRSTGGVGLGLAIARRCMEAHGGGAFAETGPGGKGLTITLWLPERPAGGEGAAR